MYKRQVLDGEPRYVDLSYRDQDTPVITYDEKWQNTRQKVKAVSYTHLDVYKRQGYRSDLQYSGYGCVI